MRVQSPEIIREKAEMTAYRIAKMLGISQKNYNDIVSGAIKIPSGRVIANLILIAVKYAKMTEKEALKLICDDFGIDQSEMKERYNDNKKVEYKKK